MAIFRFTLIFFVMILSFGDLFASTCNDLFENTQEALTVGSTYHFTLTEKVAEIPKHFHGIFLGRMNKKNEHFYVVDSGFGNLSIVKTDLVVKFEKGKLDVKKSSLFERSKSFFGTFTRKVANKIIYGTSGLITVPIFSTIMCIPLTIPISYTIWQTHGDSFLGGLFAVLFFGQGFVKNLLSTYFTLYGKNKIDTLNDKKLFKAWEKDFQKFNELLMSAQKEVELESNKVDLPPVYIADNIQSNELNEFINSITPKMSKILNYMKDLNFVSQNLNGILAQPTIPEIPSNLLPYIREQHLMIMSPKVNFDLSFFIALGRFRMMRWIFNLPTVADVSQQSEMETLKIFLTSYLSQNSDSKLENIVSQYLVFSSLDQVPTPHVYESKSNEKLAFKHITDLNYVVGENKSNKAYIQNIANQLLVNLFWDLRSFVGKKDLDPYWKDILNSYKQDSGHLDLIEFHYDVIKFLLSFFKSKNTRIFNELKRLCEIYGFYLPEE